MLAAELLVYQMVLSELIMWKNGGKSWQAFLTGEAQFDHCEHRVSHMLNMSMCQSFGHHPVMEPFREITLGTMVLEMVPWSWRASESPIPWTGNGMV